MSPSPPSTTRTAHGLTRFEHLVHAIAAAGFLTQAITGFSSLLRVGANRGWPLLVHMIGAGVFTAGLTVATLLWAHRCRFGSAPSTPGPRFTAGQKVMFWVYTTLGLAVMLPMLSAMLPVFGSAAQETLVDVHLTAALAFAGTMVLHTVVSLAARRGRR